MNREKAFTTVSIQRKINVALTTTSFLEESSDRVGLIINAPLTDYFTISLEETAILNEGITLYAGNEPLILTLAEHGQLVTLSWSAISSMSAQDVTVIETFHRE